VIAMQLTGARTRSSRAEGNGTQSDLTEVETSGRLASIKKGSALLSESCRPGVDGQRQ